MRQKHLQTLFSLGLMISLFIACDNEFVELDSDLISRDIATNIDLDSVEYEVVAYNLPLGPVQTNSLPINHIGYYKDITYGESEYNYVTQIRPVVFDPTFGDNVEIDSVTLYIPFYSSVESTDEDGNNIFDLDSIYGSGKINITLHENEFFLREFDPDGELGDRQNYYSNQSLSETEFISDDLLEGPLIHEEMNFEVSAEPIILTDGDDEVTQTLGPGIRFKMDTQFWFDKIISKEGQPELGNANAFNEYFRGLYFKVTNVDGDGPLIALNLGNTLSNITMYYKSDADEDEDEDDDDDDAGDDQSTYVINFAGNQVNFIDNDFMNTVEVGDKINGDESLFLKGGEGSIAAIKLFPGVDEDDDSVFWGFKEQFASYDNDSSYLDSRRLINEANLILYVDQDLVEGNEPERLYLYDLNNYQPLVDYAADVIVQNLPRLSISSHLGILQREDDEPTGDGIKYVMRVTRHLTNLIERDSTNVTLGLAVSANVNLENGSSQGDVQAIEDSEELVPLSSIVSPRGTVIHGNATTETEKRLKLKIFYTCIDEFEDCDN